MKTIWILTEDKPDEVALKRELRRTGFNVQLFDRSLNTPEFFNSGDVIMVQSWRAEALTFAYMRDQMQTKGKRLHLVAFLREAGSYDPAMMAARGFELPTKDWIGLCERAVMSALDACLVESEYHRSMIAAVYEDFDVEQIQVVGGVVSAREFVPCKKLEKQKRVFFPYTENAINGMADFVRVRDAYEKMYPEDEGIQWAVMGNRIDDRAIYIEEMARAKVAFAAGRTEVWPTEMIEASMVGTYPVAPARACYPEVLGADYCYEDTTEAAVKMVHARLHATEKMRPIMPNVKAKLREALEAL